MKEIFAKNLKKLRLKLNKSQYDMAQMLELSPNGYSNYELGKRYPTSDTLCKFTQLWGINLNWLLADLGTMYLKGNTLSKTDNLPVITNIKHFSNRIIHIMDIHNLSNGDMAKLTKVSESDFVKISVGKKLPDLDFLNNLKANFDVDIDWLLYGDAEPPTSKKEVSNADKNLPPLTSEQYQKLLKLLQDI